MESLSICGTCGREHSTQVGGTCPASGAAISAEAALTEGVVLAPEQGSALESREVPGATARQLAGYALVLLGAMGLIASALQVFGASSEARIGAAVKGVSDLAIGGLLVAGSSRAKTLAIVLCCVGILATPVILNSVGAEMGVVRLLFFVGMLLLLVGKPGSGRTAIGGLLVLGYVGKKLLFAYAAAQRSGRWDQFWRAWLFG